MGIEVEFVGMDGSEVKVEVEVDDDGDGDGDDVDAVDDGVDDV